ncbi:MAG TPA: toll/interleukin-1 receptor domain-containing protein [Terricaulis sp.]|nr:toll/interleukin-1 receptor domain-containing protein [Terricaulis sp.]HRP11801.1 toll/interleukin-1 receptor domain-containing protein [Terricaulis sp.]
MKQPTEVDRLSVKFSRAYKVLVQLYPFQWHVVLARVEEALVGGLTVAQALRAVNICRGLPAHDRKILIAELVRDRREILRGQQNFHTPLTEVTLDQLVEGVEVGFFSYLSGSVGRGGGKVPHKRLTQPVAGLVFISHQSSKDGSLANALVRHLERGGQKCWIAPRDTKRGRWNPQVLRAVHNCETFIALLSDAALASERVVGEIQIAVSRRKTILPIRLQPSIDAAEFDIGLQPSHCLDWFDNDAQRADGLARLVANLMRNGPQDLSR